MADPLKTSQDTLVGQVLALDAKHGAAAAALDAKLAEQEDVMRAQDARLSELARAGELAQASVQ